MLHEFRVDNFKSLINVVFKPRGVNLLLGRNNSGKTNLCQALQFLSCSASTSLNACADLAARGRFGMSSFGLAKSTIDFHVRAAVPYRDEDLVFEYDLAIRPPGNYFPEATVLLSHEVLSVTGGPFNARTVLLENAGGRTRLLNESVFLQEAHPSPGDADHTTCYRETTAPTDATMLQRLYDAGSNPRAILFRQYLTGWTYYDLSPASMRSPEYKPGNLVLLPDGANLATALFLLKTGNERDYRKLLEVVQEVDPRLHVINFTGDSNKSVFMFLEDSNGNRLPVVNASSGTLRFLAMAYILLFQPTNLLSPLCMVEEPENGLHVGFLKTLFSMVDQSVGRPQLLFASHAPYFIDLFDEHLDGVFVLNRKQGHTSITQPDTKAVRKRLEDFPLGEQHYREMLG